jgi:hypothetical protein
MTSHEGTASSIALVLSRMALSKTSSRQRERTVSATCCDAALRVR